MSYLISYDLYQPGQNYEDLISAIKKYGTYCNINKSDWIIVTSDSASVIRDNLSKYIDANDKLFVAKLTGDAAWKNYGTKVAEWLQKYL